MDLLLAIGHRTRAGSTPALPHHSITGNDNMGKRIGFYHEMRIMLHLLKLEFVVSKPQGDYSPYDLISDWNGKINRLQIKSTSRSSGTKNRGYKVICCKGRDAKIKLTKKDCDFIVITCLENVNYIIPIEVIFGKTIYVHPHYPYKENSPYDRLQEPKFEIYREKWDLLK
ncbi:MAG: hypothetical protein KKD18_06390 [Nanoarchaeota archaeon]|nr:hypothetical protein [Nanoarchaeota archaeon]